MIGNFLKYLRLDLLARPMMPIGGWLLRKSPRMLTCRQFNDFVYDYLDDNLSSKQVTLFLTHMRVCPMCRQYLKTYSAVLKAEEFILPYEDIELPETVPKDLIDAILNVRSLR